MYSRVRRLGIQDCQEKIAPLGPGLSVVSQSGAGAVVYNLVCDHRQRRAGHVLFRLPHILD